MSARAPIVERRESEDLALATDRVQVIDRSIDLLEAMQEGPLSLTALSQNTGLSKATAYRLLGGLTFRDFVIKDPMNGTYMLGPALLRLGQGAMAGIGSMALVGRAALEELCRETSETVALHTQGGLDRVVVDEIPSPHSVRYAQITGSRVPLFVGSSGIVLLAFAEEGERAQTLELLGAAFTDFDKATTVEKISRAQKRGWSISVGDRVPGAAAISVPIENNLRLLTLNVLGPSDRLSTKRMESFVPLMRKAAGRMRDLLDAQVSFRSESPLGRV